MEVFKMVLGLGILQLYNRRIGNLSEACVYLLEFGAKKVKTNCTCVNTT